MMRLCREEDQRWKSSHCPFSLNLSLISLESVRVATFDESPKVATESVLDDGITLLLHGKPDVVLYD